MQSQQIVQDAKRKGVGVINEAQEDAQKKVQEIYEKANGYKKEADDYYKNKIEEAQSDAERVLKENENLSNKIVEEAREKVTVMREFAQRELDQFKNKSLLEVEELKKTILNDAEKEKELLLQRTDREAQKKVQSLVKETEENNRVERDKRILDTKTEIEQIKKDSAAATGNPISVVANLTLPFGFGEAAAFHAGKLVFKASLQNGTYEGLWTADATHTCTDTTPTDPANPVENSCANLLNDIMDAPGASGPPARPRFTSFGGVVRNPGGTMGAIAYFTTAENPVGFYRFDDAGAPAFIARGNQPFVGNPEELAITTVGGIAFHGGFYLGGTPQDGNRIHVGLHVEELGFRQVYQAFTTDAPGIAGAKLGNPLGLALLDTGLALGAIDIHKPGDPLHQKNGVWKESAPWTPELVAHEGQSFAGGGGATFGVFACGLAAEHGLPPSGPLHGPRLCGLPSLHGPSAECPRRVRSGRARTGPG